MGYNLTIDQGNSAVKISVWQGRELVFDSTECKLTMEKIDKIASQYAIDAAICCSVVGNTVEIVETLSRITGKVYDMGQQTKLPLTIGYKTPETLGRDRIASAVGAWDKHQGRWLLVIDMGTAITYDVISPQGKFIGGNISPGINMRINAMHQFTAKLPQIGLEGDCPQWGYDTETALRSGVINGIVGEMIYYRSMLHCDSEVVLTGGVATLFEQKVKFPVEVDQHLVTKGLNCILLYNENR